MLTHEGAKRAVTLCKDRKRILEEASGVCSGRALAAMRYDAHKAIFCFVRLTDELVALIKREAAAQIAAIDAELNELGVKPDELDDEERRWLGRDNVVGQFFDFDEKVRLLAGTLAGQISDEDLGTLRKDAFGISPGTSGIDINVRVDGNQLPSSADSSV
jgi:hypothetical protein